MVFCEETGAEIRRTHGKRRRSRSPPLKQTQPDPLCTPAVAAQPSANLTMAPILSDAVGSASESSLCIDWSRALPIPTSSQELAALPTLLPGKWYSWRLESYEPTKFADLPARRQEAIASIAVKHGLHLAQAASLRRQILGSAAPWKLHGDEAAELEAATHFEDAVGRFLLRQGVVFLTQEGIKAEALAAGESISGLATPDFLIRCELKVNGQPVRWIEVKRWYATGYAGLQPWQPSRKALKQLERYRTLYGPGAVVLLHGHSTGFRERVHTDIQLLDAGPFQADVDRSR